MTIESQSNGPTPAARRPLFNRNIVLAFFAGTALAAGVVAIAHGDETGAWHRGMMMGGSHSPAEVSAHVDKVLKHLYVEIDATDAQQAQIAPLVKQAVNELLPLRAQAQAAHAQAIDSLSQTAVDRAGLENARSAQLQLVDQASRRITQLLADVGDVLTPAQRTQLAAHLKKMHGMSGA